MFNLRYEPPSTDVKFKRHRRAGVYARAFGGAALLLALSLFYLIQYVKILELNYTLARRGR